jgi:hypothetical protein
VNALQAAGLEPPADDLGAYLDLSRDQIAHLILCLMIEEALRQRLLAFRQNPAVQPVQRLEKLGV